MGFSSKGELVPVGGGDPIPLIRLSMKIGRRESCDICLRFPNISGLHCELNYSGGCWQIIDLGSTNGVKVNGTRVDKKILRPGDEIAIANHRYKIEYSLAEVANPEILEETVEEDFRKQSLLEKAGLLSKRRQEGRSAPGPRRPARPPEKSSPPEEDG